MKTLLSKIANQAYISFGLMLLSCTGFAKSHVTMSVRNITATTHTLEYDLYIVNDGNTSLKLSACSYGLNYSSGILNGGTLSYSYVENSRSRAIQNWSAYSFKNTISDEGNQARMTSTPVRNESALELASNVPYRIGRVRLTNSNDWSKNSDPSLALQEQMKIGFTTTQVVVFEDGNTAMRALIPSKKEVNCVVEKSALLNPEQPITISQTTVSSSSQHVNGMNILTANSVVKVYPNPADGELTVDFSIASKTETHIRISDVNGRLVKEIQTISTEGENKILIDVSELKKGMYVLKLFADSALQFTEKFLKK